MYMDRMSLYLSLTVLLVTLLVAAILLLSLVNIFVIPLGISDNLYIILFIFSLFLLAITFQEKTVVFIMILIYVALMLILMLFMGLEKALIASFVIIMILSFITISRLAK